jgi:hypothetical protein
MGKERERANSESFACKVDRKAKLCVDGGLMVTKFFFQNINKV